MIHFHSPNPDGVTDSDKALLGINAPALVRPYLTLWRDERATPLISLASIAAETKVANVLVKDEGQRLGLGSFKALGGAYAVMTLFKRTLEERLGEEVSVAQLTSPRAREPAAGMTFCCATDGNHGKSVAAGARILGCRSVIFVHEGVTAARAEAIGADEVIRVPGNYDRSVDEAERVAMERDWCLVSDTSWEGYEEIPSLVAQGYTVLAEEALTQIGAAGIAPPTHVFLQAGVGGFASSISLHLSEALGERGIKTVIVEPDRAACLFVSAEAGRLTSFSPVESTIMAMLECYTPSLVAWRILNATASAFLTVTEEEAKIAMRRLAAHRPPIVAGESGAAGLAGYLSVATDPEARSRLGLTEQSRVLLINTEGATDPASYESIVGATADEVRQCSLSQPA
ncbi:diaminopropionate ammonia-lyase [Pararhizobium sp. YC-54]|uniref:diaminopropionate ammonia-lyase n=1 Tax=Pararhizobium sp. YC-54 TaxID=2986920 RepID=UPI0021F7BC1E|nr:diaminopropionate ammonia-lyase [Pararhizobium sp. YC-54]MCV9999285.1 diaminopropionate ammonia-lyase [Pararhizobium sp. YC-54]